MLRKEKHLSFEERQALCWMGNSEVNLGKGENNIYIYAHVCILCVCLTKLNVKRIKRRWLDFCFSVNCLEMISHISGMPCLRITIQQRSALDSWSFCIKLLSAWVTGDTQAWLMGKNCLHSFSYCYYIITSFHPSLSSFQMLPFMPPCSISN